MGTWMAETCRWLLYNKITFIKPNCILFVFLINVIQVTGCCEYCRLNKRAGPVKCVINPCPAGELLAFQGLCFTQLAVWFVSYVSQVVDKIILCKPLPRIHSKALYSPMNSESLYGETKKLWEWHWFRIVSIIALGLGHQRLGPRYRHTNTKSHVNN
jgi:hypothetical protein